MKTLYLECTMGAAGDMLMAALVELHPNPDEFIDRLNNIGIPHVRAEKTQVVKCGIQGTGINVRIHGHGEEEHIHEHHHRGIAEINDIVSSLGVSDKIKKDIMAVYDIIARAESKAHGQAVELIHFHEIGAMDAVADIAGVCMLLDELAPDRIVASHIHVGCGQVRCAHGVLPVPAPATAHILEGVPTYGGAVQGELCTPTGAALIRYFAHEFVKENCMTVSKIGYGMGKRRYYNDSGDEILSSVRAMMGERDRDDEVAVLSCNIDDMTGEQLGFATELLTASGALETYTTSVYTKKNRPGILLTVVCKISDKERLTRLIFKHTSTIGIREQNVGRYVLNRTSEIVHTKYGDVSVKKSQGYGVSKTKPEYEDLKRIALENDMSIAEVISAIKDEL